MGPLEVVFVDKKKISCDGEKGSSSHPLIYLNMGEKENISCPYCGKNFAIKKSSNAPTANVDFFSNLRSKIKINS